LLNGLVTSIFLYLVIILLNFKAENYYNKNEPTII
jgi:hypothetical protein